MATTIPENLRVQHRTIASMIPGEHGWTVSWAMCIDHDWQCWLRGDYTIQETPGGTVNLLVERRTDGTYAVEVPMPEEGWRLGRDTTAQIPVTDLLTTTSRKMASRK